MLEALHSLNSSVIETTVPFPVESVSAAGLDAMVLTLLPGTPMTTLYHRWGHTRSHHRVARDLGAVAEWLQRLQHETSRRQRGRGDGQRRDRASDAPVRRRARTGGGRRPSRARVRDAAALPLASHRRARRSLVRQRAGARRRGDRRRRLGGGGASRRAAARSRQICAHLCALPRPAHAAGGSGGRPSRPVGRNVGLRHRLPPHR